MKKSLEATGVFGFSLAVSVAVLAVMLPLHPRSASADHSAVIVPAVFAPGYHARAGSSGSSGEASPDATGCPYLDSREQDAAGSCPAQPEVKTESGCPFLEQQREKTRKSKEALKPVLGQHT